MWTTRRPLALGLVGGLAALYALRKLTRPAPVQAPGLRDTPDAPHIVILGAGFAGTYTARELARLLPHARDARITLVNETNFLLFTPMLTEVVSGDVDPHDIVSALRRVSKRITFLRARVDHIDLSDRSVTVNVVPNLPGIPTAMRTLHADHLVIALGSATNFYDIPGLERYALPVKHVADAEAIHDRLLTALERADAEPDQDLRRSLLTLVVGGGGFSGVETMAALNDFVRAEARRYPRIAPDDITTILVHPEDRLLPELSADLAAYAQRQLEHRGVRIILNARIVGAGPDYVDVQGQPRIPTHTLIWTGGVTPSLVTRNLDAQHGRHHGIVVDASLQVPGHSGVWALGDSAEIPHPDGGSNYAPTAQNATREGIHVARNIAAVLRGAPPQPFVYRPIGELAMVGRRAGVANVYGFRVSGLPAWLLWRAIYLAKEPSTFKRVHTAVDWTLDLLGGRVISQIPNPPPVPTAGPSAEQPWPTATPPSSAAGAHTGPATAPSAH
jgi:NADH:ubiquinone reductase (H+-translocating)